MESSPKAYTEKGTLTKLCDMCGAIQRGCTAPFPTENQNPLHLQQQHRHDGNGGHDHLHLRHGGQHPFRVGRHEHAELRVQQQRLERPADQGRRNNDFLRRQWQSVQLVQRFKELQWPDVAKRTPARAAHHRRQDEQIHLRCRRNSLDEGRQRHKA